MIRRYLYRRRNKAFSMRLYDLASLERMSRHARDQMRNRVEYLRKMVPEAEQRRIYGDDHV